MKFLTDNALPPCFADLLSAAAYDSVHVRTYGMQAAPDHEILARAFEEERILVSADTDFATLLAAQRSDRPSFILFRQTNLFVAEDYFNLLIPSLNVLQPELLAGCVAVFRNNRLRVHRLPFAS